MTCAAANGQGVCVPESVLCELAYVTRALADFVETGKAPAWTEEGGVTAAELVKFLRQMEASQTAVPSPLIAEALERMIKADEEELGDARRRGFAASR